MRSVITSLIIIAIIIGGVRFMSSKDNWKYQVILADGSVKVIKADNKEKKLQARNYIYSNEKIHLEDNAYLAISDRSNYTIELKKPGVYEVNDLKRSNNNLPQRYLDYIINSLKDSDDVNLVGGVERGLTPGGSQVTVVFPRTTKIMNPKIDLIWNKFNNSNKYKVTVFNNKYNIMYSKEINDTTTSIDLTPYKKQSDICYYWAVSDASDENTMSNPYCLYWLNDSEIKEMAKELDVIKLGLIDKSAINDLILANFYEENGLMIEANKHYLEALNNSNNINAYKKIYNNFLIKSGIVAGR